MQRREEEGEEGGKGELVDGFTLQKSQGRAGELHTDPPVPPGKQSRCTGDEAERVMPLASTQPSQMLQTRTTTSSPAGGLGSAGQKRPADECLDVLLYSAGDLERGCETTKRGKVFEALLHAFFAFFGV